MNWEKALETIIVLALVALVASLLLNVNWLMYVSITLLVLSIISKKATMIISNVWLSFSHYFGLVMNSVVMFIIFFLFLVPISFFQRLFGKNQLLKKGTTNSHFIIRNHWYTKKDIEKPW